MSMQYKIEILPTVWEDLKITDNILNCIERLETSPDSEMHRLNIQSYFHDMQRGQMCEGDSPQRVGTCPL